MLTIYLIKNTVKQLYYKVLIQFKIIFSIFKYFKKCNSLMWWFIIITNVEVLLSILRESRYTFFISRIFESIYGIFDFHLEKQRNKT